MNISEQTAKNLRDVHFGGNWSTSNLKEHLADVTLRQATTKVYELNTIAELVYHINYYVAAVIKVLQGDVLNAADKYSFNLPKLNTENDWEKLVNKTLHDAETFAMLIEQLPEDKFWGPFSDEKYGSYFRNLLGIVEHTHYHLGQIVLLKKIITP